MNQTKKILSVIMLVSALTVLMASGQNTGEIIILHTNDMHAKIDNLGKLAYLADSLKKIYPYVYLVSSGDNFTGNPVVDMISETGYPMIDLMNRCGFNVSTIGNHEFDMGQTMMNKRFAQATFPFISCNINTDSAILHQPHPDYILKAGDLATIAFLGAIELNDEGIPDTHPLKVAGVKFTDAITEMKKYSGLKQQYGILIGLTHLGIETDKKLAEEMPQLDMIMGGHSHTLMDTLMIVNGVRITQAGANMKYIGKTTLEITDGKVTNIKDEMIAVSTLHQSDAEMQKLISKYNDVEEFKRIAGFAEKPVTGLDELGSLMTDADNDYMKTDFAFQNIGGIRSLMLDSGNITLQDIYKLDPFGNKVTVYRMTAEQITGLIRYGYNLEKVPDLQVSGMKYTIHTDQQGNFLSADLVPDKGIADPEKIYLVSMNSYMAVAYRFEYVSKVTESEENSAGILIRFLEKRKKINYAGVKRVELQR